MPTYKLADTSVGEDGEKKVYPVIPDGLMLIAEVVSVEEKPAPWKDDDGNEIRRVNFRFRIIQDGEWQGRSIWGDTPTTFSNNPECKLRAWSQEIFGVDQLPPGFDLDTDELVGLECQIAVGNRVVRKGTPEQATKDYAADVFRAPARSNAGTTASEIF